MLRVGRLRRRGFGPEGLYWGQSPQPPVFGTKQGRTRDQMDNAKEEAAFYPSPALRGFLCKFRTSPAPRHSSHYRCMNVCAEIDWIKAA